MSFNFIGFIGFFLGPSVIAALITYIFNNKKLHADLVSKSRIEWIQEVRGVFSEYLMLLNNLIYVSHKISTIKSNIVKSKGAIVYSGEYMESKVVSKNIEETEFQTVQYEERVEDENYKDLNRSKHKEIDNLRKKDKELQFEFWETYIKLEKKQMLLELYLPNKIKKYSSNKDEEDEHNIIKEKISNIINDSILNFAINTDNDSAIWYIHDYIKRDIKYEFDEKVITFDILKKDNKDLINYVSQYLKKEWDRAKKNK
ncbi:hypothetical protein [Mammaliicoccus sciuri]|uniref:hypothetical protein n=1 Tax=Mammaliicoccus sciuri TaxID=1296 RepID=UPI0021D1BA6D|nr:hypothetical protein [Mammaliicoccus sciuri]UXU79094.1 hypothetical protein MUA27_05645 [Mammaliicoccus sciuri]WQL18525.1 hypothetical protein P3U34_05505 [Mammaliicoccus sciuri]